MKLQKNSLTICSGGQTGVDRAALDFALCNDFQCLGWCSQNRMAEDGLINFRYPLDAVYSGIPQLRTELNVLDSDGTLLIIFDNMDQGTLLTYELAKYNHKPIFVWAISNKGNEVRKFDLWLVNNAIKQLNIAGPRESNSPGIYDSALELLEKLLC